MDFFGIQKGARLGSEDVAPVEKNARRKSSISRSTSPEAVSSASTLARSELIAPGALFCRYNLVGFPLKFSPPKSNKGKHESPLWGKVSAATRDKKNGKIAPATICAEVGWKWLTIVAAEKLWRVPRFNRKLGRFCESRTAHRKLFGSLGTNCFEKIIASMESCQYRGDVFIRALLRFAFFFNRVSLLGLPSWPRVAVRFN